MSEKTRAELKEQIKIMNHNYQVIREMREKGYQYSVSEIKRLQDELDRTRKALDGAKKALNDIQFTDDGNQIVDIRSFAHHALEQITALEQKDVKWVKRQKYLNF